MPKLDFAAIEEASDFTPVPEDRYLCKLTEVEEKTTDHGDEMWKFKFEIQNGKYKGRYLFDQLVFSEAALKRVKLVCSRFGLDVTGEVDLVPEMVKGKLIYVLAEDDFYEKDGKRIPTNKVGFAGYEHYGGGEETAMAAGTKEDAGEGNLPF